MRFFLGVGSDLSEDKLRFAAQIGVESVSAAPKPQDLSRGYYDFQELLTAKTLIESYGLQFEILRMLPWEWCYKYMMGLPGRDEQIENFQKSLRNIAAVGIPTLIYNMHVLRFYRTSWNAPGRAGSSGSSFDLELVENAPLMTAGPGINIGLVPPEHRKPISDEQMWDNLTYFLKAVIPVAEEVGIRLALHPDDPPVPNIAGVARIMRSPEAYRKLIEIDTSDANGIAFCQGCFTEMGANLTEEIQYFGSRNKIVTVDFRNVKGTTTKFQESFPDDGQADLYATMKAYIDVGFDGPMTPDHAMHIIGDSDWGHRYWSFAIGHMRGLSQAIDRAKSE